MTAALEGTIDVPVNINVMMQVGDTDSKGPRKGPREAHIEWTREASVQVGDEWYFTFQRYSYAAKVTFADKPDERYIIALPPGAAQRPANDYAPAVINYALRMERLGEQEAVLPADHIVVTQENA